MKHFLATSLLVAASVSPAPCETGTAAPMRDAATHTELSHAYSKASQQDPLRNLPAVKGEDPSLKVPESILKSSDFISFGGNVTLVPKRAIINLPKKFEDRITLVKGSKIMSWAEFLTLNRGWITTVEVSRSQAEGNQAIDEKILERVHGSANLVVATLRNGPISVLPLKEAEEPKAAKP
jgi:hypothetical protein